MTVGKEYARLGNIEIENGLWHCDESKLYALTD